MLRVTISFGAVIESSAPRAYKESSTNIEGFQPPQSSGGVSLQRRVIVHAKSASAQARSLAEARTRIHDLTNNQLKTQVFAILEKRKQKQLMASHSNMQDAIQRNIESTRAENIYNNAMLKASNFDNTKMRIYQAQEAKSHKIEEFIDHVSSMRMEKVFSVATASHLHRVL